MSKIEVFTTVINTHGTTSCKNIYIDMDGTLKPMKLPFNGMGVYDGQVVYRQRPLR